jgi:hypothetical protein
LNSGFVLSEYALILNDIDIVFYLLYEDNKKMLHQCNLINRYTQNKNKIPTIDINKLASIFICFWLKLLVNIALIIAFIILNTS